MGNTVDKVKISDMQNTTVFPEASRVILKENTNI